MTVGQALAQKTSPEGRPDIKQGNILPGDFSKAPYAIDSSAHAVVLMDIGESEFTGNSQSSFDLVYTHQKRMHIINKKIGAGMPIAETVYQILWQQLPASEGFRYIEKNLV